MIDDYILQVKDLYKEFNLESGYFSKKEKFVYAVNNVSFNLKRGTTLGIVGESGCGKTTTARLLIKMYQATKGSILFNSKELNKTFDLQKISKKELKNYREKVKYIFQDPARSLNPRMKVLNILTDGLKYSSLYKDKNNNLELAKNIIKEVGLSEEDLYRRPQEFSGGQRQRISIARGLIMNPELLICDEVVSALDVSIQGQIINLLQELKEKRGLTYIFITHDLKVASFFCDTINVMYRGMIVEEYTGSQLYKDAVHPYTKLLFQGSSSSNLEVKTTLQKECSCPFFHRCTKKTEQCQNNIPPLVKIGENHSVRCFNI